MERDRKRYSTLAKTIVLGIQMTAAVVLAVGVILFGACVTQKLLPWTRSSIGMIAGGGFTWIFGLCYMTVATGKRREDSKLHLFAFDRLRTEIPVAMLLGSFGLIAFLAARAHRQVYQLPGRMVIAGTFALLADICFMGLYLSLVRRVKADTFLENSCINWLIVNARDTFRSRYLGYGTRLAVCGFVLASLLAGYLSFGRGFYWAYILLAVMIVYAMIRFSKRIVQRAKILEGIERITQGDLEYRLKLDQFQGDERLLAEAINHIREGLSNAIGERVRDERMKADLITNVSHDLKTPLTSIINYVGLLRRENIQNANAQNYIDVLDQKAQRLKQLMEDLLEVSRISSGNIVLQMDDIDLVELVRQTGGEYNEKLEDKGLNVITKFPRETVMICADGRQLWRVIGNLYSNAAKYAMPDTRVYVEVEQKDDRASFSIRNISEYLPDVGVDELTERFVRGDESRSTEGSGLGLSISRMLTERMGGTFEIDLEDDLFRVRVSFPCEMKGSRG